MFIKHCSYKGIGPPGCLHIVQGGYATDLFLYHFLSQIYFIIWLFISINLCHSLCNHWKTVQHQWNDWKLLTGLHVLLVEVCRLGWRGCCSTFSGHRVSVASSSRKTFYTYSHNLSRVKNRILNHVAEEAAVSLFLLRFCLLAYSGQHFDKMINALWLSSVPVTHSKWHFLHLL